MLRHSPSAATRPAPVVFLLLDALAALADEWERASETDDGSTTAPLNGASAPTSSTEGPTDGQS